MDGYTCIGRYIELDISNHKLNIHIYSEMKHAPSSIAINTQLIQATRLLSPSRRNLKNLQEPTTVIQTKLVLLAPPLSE